MSRGRVPWPLVIPAALGLAFLVLPLGGLLLRAPWSTLGTRLAEPQVLTALRLSLVTATLATGLCLLLGVPLAWALARGGFRGGAWCGRWSRCRWCCRRWWAGWRC